MNGKMQIWLTGEWTMQMTSGNISPKRAEQSGSSKSSGDDTPTPTQPTPL